METSVVHGLFARAFEWETSMIYSRGRALPQLPENKFGWEKCPVKGLPQRRRRPVRFLKHYGRNIFSCERPRAVVVSQSTAKCSVPAQRPCRLRTSKAGSRSSRGDEIIHFLLGTGQDLPINSGIGRPRSTMGVGRPLKSWMVVLAASMPR